ncbi:response regulator transcription factor [Kitasatospora purpeofusca]|uniref:response regulator transcription factor n=1 Tax=Kitasatospora purpeofusca TaxID=67352 RepID=UPI0038651AE7|nr:helix-turn-helix transcriptional regulator [Kitasatospora purpeofusca]
MTTAPTTPGPPVSGPPTSGAPRSGAPRSAAPAPDGPAAPALSTPDDLAARAAAWCGAPAADPAPRGPAPSTQRYAPRHAQRYAPRPAPPLTRREHEVLRWAATGRTNPEIAAQLGLTCNTVTGYLKSAMHKLGVRNRTELALAARESGLLD